MTTISPVGTTTVERWVFERELRATMTSRGIVPPWLLPENQPRIPEMPEPLSPEERVTRLEQKAGLDA